MSNGEAIQKLLAERKELQAKLDDPKKEARIVYDLIFKKRFKTGGDWIERNKRIGQRDAMIVSLLGGVRHLWAYLHPEEKVSSAMDRRGTNSIVQGPASNLGYIGGYFVRKLLWDFYESQGIDLGVMPLNAVHDSQEYECPPINIPLLDYICTHACSTMLHLWMRDVMGFETNTSFEMDSAIGATLSEMHEAMRWDDQVAAIRKSLEWKRDNLGSKQPIDLIMPIVQHNGEIMFEFRRKEIKRQLDDNERVSYNMNMTRDNALKLGLKFEMPPLPKTGKARANDDWKRELV